MHKYQVEEQIGEGNFGLVLRAQHVETGEMVAIKKISVPRIQDGIPNNALREVKALQLVQIHPNVIKLHEVFAQGSSVALVTELMVTDLSEVLRNSCRALPEARAKSYMVMLLRGLQHIHSYRIIHRDIKPGNCLISSNGELKIGDFGLARVWHNDGRPMTHEVATRWYRAPELLFGSRHYTTSVDMWAAGCVFGEMLCGSPLFCGDGDIDQINRIFLRMGTPNETTWPKIRELPDWNKIQFAKVDPKPLHSLCPDRSTQSISLLSSLLVYDQDKRATALQCLSHTYFFTDPLPLQPNPLDNPALSRTTRPEFWIEKSKLKVWEVDEFLVAPFNWPYSPDPSEHSSEQSSEAPGSPLSSNGDAEDAVIRPLPQSLMDMEGDMLYEQCTNEDGVVVDRLILW
eukprot:NODE_3840_length_1276_cov_49.248916_g3365_i0.p1 GENE.NODE_3840_length_1276_cov_49.248916_g3365_i0~~NODE_3840_length_1276_cov_49.248916_g3365_i0.p1  ORF type:complete len:401 (+),score=77.09 NODE_3840_length_1276_cov_49.248916_g3365_i0:36-1238(+)